MILNRSFILKNGGIGKIHKKKKYSMGIPTKKKLFLKISMYKRDKKTEILCAGKKEAAGIDKI